VFSVSLKIFTQPKSLTIINYQPQSHNYPVSEDVTPATYRKKPPEKRSKSDEKAKPLLDSRSAFAFWPLLGTRARDLLLSQKQTDTSCLSGQSARRNRNRK